MKEIRCQNPKCNHCLSKGIEVGAGMYYITPSKPLRLYREVIKCPKCGNLNEIIIEMGVRARVRIIKDDEGGRVNTYIIRKDELYSA